MAEATRFLAELQRGDCTSFGMPGHIRIGVRGMQDSHRLIDALRDVLVTPDG